MHFLFFAYLHLSSLPPLSTSLQKLAEDPYGVFALVLTPTRELALQIADQFRALGSSLSLRCAIAIGGGDMVEQAMQLAARPLVVVATPGRLREMLQQEATMGRIFSNLQFLVLDEADRLLDRGFEEEIGAILARMPKERQTLLFSATFTANLHALKILLFSATFTANLHALKVGAARATCIVSLGGIVPSNFHVLLFPPSLPNCTRMPMPCSYRVVYTCLLPRFLCTATVYTHIHKQTMSKTKKLFHFEAYKIFKTVEALDHTYLFLPSNVRDVYLCTPALPHPTVEALDQSYLFLPANVRDVYLCRLLSRLLPSLQTILPPAPPPSASAAARPPVRSVIVFTSSCQSCQAVSALLDEVGLSNAPLHALLPQRKRSATLHRFKASQVPILVATDVASRGLDIPTVDLVINYDIPK
ncbi:unnamed protein product [Closterium sp. NIES-53]